MLQSYIPFLPEGAEPINDHVAIYRHDEKIEFYTASGPIYSFRESDSYGLRLAQGIIVTLTTTTPAEIAKALSINRTTAYRNVNRYQQDGPAALITDKKSNRKLTNLTGRLNARSNYFLMKAIR